MKSLSKICDAADWFDTEFYSITLNELKEPPRFHRKQWEFAMIFLALKKLGCLNENMTGLSLGGGNERVLYSIAQHVNKLIVTDLYDEDTTWDCAKTKDPDEYIKASKPFEVDLSKIKALRMDMRNLDFEDNTFDFCYSSCAIEHIGDFNDFVQHLDEVYRVLKEDGVYVFTTELKIGSETIKDENNFIFSSSYLKDIFKNIKLTPDIDADVNLAHHEINTPLPSNVKNLCYNNDASFTHGMMKNYPHVVLLRGKYPFTSIQFVMRKKSVASIKKEVKFNGLTETENYLQNRLQKYSELLQNSVVSFNPFSSLPDNVSHYFLDHSNFFSGNRKDDNSDTLFHTDYFWLGSGERVFKIKFDVADVEVGLENIIQLRIHSYSTLNSKNVECVFEEDLDLKVIRSIEEFITLDISDDYCYAIVGKMKSGNCTIKNLSLESWNLKNQNINAIKRHSIHQSERVAE
jgi:ubiquinone/menaquinone biosynthesis C-methylase UbiE